MRKFKFSASSIALVLGATSPTLAQDPPPLFVDPNPELSALCDLKPGLESGFEAVAINVVVDQGGSSTTVDDPNGIVTITGDGVPTTTTTITGPAHRHGQSPNIFGFITTVLTYATSTRHIPTITTTTGSSTSFDCHVHKYTGGSMQDEIDHVGYKIAPPGLQSDPVVIEEDPTITYGERTEPGPANYQVTTQDKEDGVICISPGTSKGSLGGTWRSQNGYTGTLGTCSRAFFDSLAAPVGTDPIPSESLPPA